MGDTSTVLRSKSTLPGFVLFFPLAACMPGDGSSEGDDEGGSCVVADASTNPGTLSLASLMDQASGMSEDQITGSLAAIEKGTGEPGDADGLYDVNDPDTMFGSLDVFPNEADFAVGTLTYDRDVVCDEGEIIVPVDSVEIAGLWTAGSATTDINDEALTAWFTYDHSLDLGPVEDGATVRFVDGELVSIDLTAGLSLTVDLPDDDTDPVWEGSLVIAGSQISALIDDTEQEVDLGIFGVVDSRLVLELTGDVLAVD